MSISDPLNHFESIWYHSEPSGITYSTNRFLDLDFFAVSYSKTALAHPFYNYTAVKKAVTYNKS